MLPPPGNPCSGAGVHLGEVIAMKSTVLLVLLAGASALGLAQSGVSPWA